MITIVGVFFWLINSEILEYVGSYHIESRSSSLFNGVASSFLQNLHKEIIFLWRLLENTDMLFSLEDLRQKKFFFLPLLCMVGDIFNRGSFTPLRQRI